MAQNLIKKEEEKYSYSLEKPQYKNSYETPLQETYEQISSRPRFSYQPDTDPLYRKYKSDYIKQGQLAMKDSAGQASALTGGYGSSYAQNVGQQQYDAYLEKLGDIVPELYQLAYSRYSDEGDRLERQYERLQKLRDEEYRRYTDELDRYEDEQQLAYEREKEAQAYREKQAEQEYSRKQQEAATLAKYGDFSGYAAIYGEATAKSMKEYWIASNPDAAYNLGLVDAGRYFALTGKYAPGQAPAAPAGNSSSRSSSYYPGTAPDGRDAREVQRELRNMGYNIAVDGAWGPKSQSAWDKAYGGGNSSYLPKLGNDANYLVRV